MALRINGDEQSLFPHNREFNEGVNQRGIRPGQATIVVALDGSGDAESMQEGIDMLPTTGGFVFMKEGTYSIHKPIIINNTNVQVIGSGKSTIINSSSKWVEGEAYLIDGSSNTGGDYRDIQLDMTDNSVGGSVILGLDAANESIIGNCWFSNGGGSVGINVNDNTVIIKNQLADQTKINIEGKNNNITGNILITGSRIISDASGERNIISNNVVVGGIGTGIIIYGDRNIIMGNTVRDRTGYTGMRIESGATNNIVVGNMLYGNTTAYTDNGTNTQPNGAMGTNNLAFDDLNMIT